MNMRLSLDRFTRFLINITLYLRNMGFSIGIIFLRTVRREEKILEIPDYGFHYLFVNLVLLEGESIMKVLFALVVHGLND